MSTLLGDGWSLIGWFPYDMQDTFVVLKEGVRNAMSRDVCRSCLAALLEHMDSHAHDRNGAILREARLPHTFTELLCFLSAHRGDNTQRIDTAGTCVILSKRSVKHLAVQEEERLGAHGIGLYVFRGKLE